MFRFTHVQPRWVLGVLASALMLGGWAMQPVEVTAGFATSPGPGTQTSALTKVCTSGDHIKEA